MVLVGGLLITVALRLIAISERLLSICKRLIGVAKPLFSHFWTLLPIRVEPGHRRLTHLADREAEKPTDGSLGRRPRGR